MIVYASAKVNLYLALKGVRQDGYHLLETVFQEVSLCDKIVLKKSAGSGIKLTVRNLKKFSVGCTENNTIVKAYNAVCGIIGAKPGIEATLQKRIPVGAGLGGGSSDAAAFIKAFDKLCGLGLSESDKLKAAVSVGADAPFFLKGGCCAGLGIGDILMPIEAKSKMWFVIVYPRFKVDTKKAYKLYDRFHAGSVLRQSKLLTISKNINNISHYLKSGDFSALGSALKNDFEPVVAGKFTGVRCLLERLKSNPGAVYSGLSGSGSACFSMFASRGPALSFYKALGKKFGHDVYLAESPV